MPAEGSENDVTEWWRDIYAALKAADVRQVTYVPDAGHAALIEACIADEDMTAIPLTSEEEGVAVLAGAWLGGVRGVLLMQSSGVGNCINMFSLAATCRFPVPMIVSMRGQWREFNPWQNAMGQSTDSHLKTAGVATVTAASPGDVGPMSAATLDRTFSESGLAALLLHQSLMPVKTFDQ